MHSILSVRAHTEDGRGYASRAEGWRVQMAEGVKAVKAAKPCQALSSPDKRCQARPSPVKATKAVSSDAQWSRADRLLSLLRFLTLRIEFMAALGGPRVSLFWFIGE